MIDWLLAALLIIVLPGWAILKSLRQRAPVASRTRRYLLTGAGIIVLLLLLAASWLPTGLPWSQLGLGWPFTWGAAAGLAAFIGLLAVIAVVSHCKARKLTPAARSAREARAPRPDLMPQSKRELAVFLPLAVLLGCGWELLYRGFLWWFLAPRVGATAAVCIAALAYGLGHGIKSPKQALGSIWAAFAFMVAFVLTQNLWWLMLIHVAMPLLGVVAGRRKAHGRDAALRIAAK